MSERPRFESSGLVLRRDAPVGLVALRVRADDAAARAALAAALGLELPAGPARPTAGAAARLYWTAPDALLLQLATPAAAAAEAERLAAIVRGHLVAVHDIGDARTRFTIRGPQARALLAKGTSLDLDPRFFPAGGAALTRFAGLTVLLAQHDDAPAYTLLVDRPVEDWLWTWLLDAGREFGVADAHAERTG